MVSRKKRITTPGIFDDPGLTDSQGNPCVFKYKSTVWGGHIIYPEYQGTQFDYCVFSGDAYKRFLSWLVGK